MIVWQFSGVFSILFRLMMAKRGAEIDFILFTLRCLILADYYLRKMRFGLNET